MKSAEKKVGFSIIAIITHQILWIEIRLMKKQIHSESFMILLSMVYVLLFTNITQQSKGKAIFLNEWRKPLMTKSSVYIQYSKY